MHSDQATERLFIAVGADSSTISVFSLPNLAFLDSYVDAEFSLGIEPNLTLLDHAGGRRLYASDGDKVHILSASDGAKLGEFEPADALAARGVVFERAYGGPICHPARRALLSGAVWAQRYGSIPCDPGPLPGPQVGDLPLPELFRAAGYQTAGFGKWHLGEDPTSPDWPRAPFAHGFDHCRAGIPANVELCGGRNYRRWARMEGGET